MTISKVQEGDRLIIELEGQLDTLTAPVLEQEIGSISIEIKSLVFNFKYLDYISSSGLRVILVFQKLMNKQGGMVIQNVNEMIMDIFETTGFVDILTIE